VSLCTSPAGAHPAPYSYFDLRLGPAGIEGSLIIHDSDAARELGLAGPEILADPAVARSHRDRLVDVIRPRLRIVVGGAALPAAWGSMEVLPDRQSLRLDVHCDKPAPAAITVEARLFPYDPNHLTFVNVYEGESLRHQAILDANHPSMDYYAGTAAGRMAVLETFLRAGVHHILIGPDHILFLLGLLLAGGSFLRLAGIVSAFTVGHSITLSLATLDVLTLSSSLVEPAIALSIVVVGADNLLCRTNVLEAGRGALEHPHHDLRPWMGAVFGIIHGFGFASVLGDFGLPRDAVAWSLFSFNIGVEIGQLFIVAILVFVLMLARHRSASLGRRIATGGSIGIIIAGGYWFAERVLSGG
jgi:hypothetical protein